MRGAALSYTFPAGLPMVRRSWADDIAEVIRLNPIPWLFAPGIALAGWLFDGAPGAARALAIWIAIVALATAWVVVRRRYWPDEPLDTKP
jgi:hypothetical protein